MFSEIIDLCLIHTINLTVPEISVKVLVELTLLSRSYLLWLSWGHDKNNLCPDCDSGQIYGYNHWPAVAAAVCIFPGLQLTLGDGIYDAAPQLIVVTIYYIYLFISYAKHENNITFLWQIVFTRVSSNKGNKTKRLKIYLIIFNYL